LRPGGHAWLVVHKHLGSDSLARWLAAEGYGVERLRSRVGYRILEVTRP
jgi:16S rRNA (guanine1207-N2)-methyltransferase